MANIELSVDSKCRNFDIHPKYLIRLFGHPKVIESNLNGKLIIKAKIDGKEFTISYSDFGTEDTTFKMHKRIVTDPSYPIAPVSFYNWDEYNKIEKVINYNPKNNQITSRQRCYGCSVERRNRLQDKIKELKGQVKVINQLDFWMEINKIKVAVFEPGAREDILDRAQLQYFAFGCCTITPYLTNFLPFNKSFNPGEHYLELKPDHSNLNDLIDFIDQHPDEAKAIGDRAKDLFKYCCLPERQVKWIQEQIG